MAKPGRPKGAWMGHRRTYRAFLLLQGLLLDLRQIQTWPAAVPSPSDCLPVDEFTFFQSLSDCATVASLGEDSYSRTPLYYELVRNLSALVESPQTDIESLDWSSATSMFSITSMLSLLHLASGYIDELHLSLFDAERETNIAAEIYGDSFGYSLQDSFERGLLYWKAPSTSKLKEWYESQQVTASINRLEYTIHIVKNSSIQPMNSESSFLTSMMFPYAYELFEECQNYIKLFNETLVDGSKNLLQSDAVDESQTRNIRRFCELKLSDSDKPTLAKLNNCPVHEYSNAKTLVEKFVSDINAEYELPEELHQHHFQMFLQVVNQIVLHHRLKSDKQT